MNKTRCPWPREDPASIKYHDTEWGVPNHDDRKLFEFIVLDTFQAGLSWRTVLHKRAAFEKAFAGFDPQKVAKFTEADVERLAQDKNIVRNWQKIRATITNAQAFLKIQKEFGTFDKYIWQFVGGRPIINNYSRDHHVPAVSPEAEAMSRDLKARGFSFVGPTICYAFMQGAGMFNDHLTNCFRHAELSNKV